MMLLLSVLVIVTTVSAGDCPEFCECRQYPQDLDQLEVLYTSINCKANSNITHNFSNNTESQTFKNSSIQFENLLDNLCNVEDLSQLILTGIYFPNLSNISVSGLNQLSLLKISNCQVLKLPYFNLTTLKLLELSNNYLKVIESEQFRMLPVLEVLNLSINVIESIHSSSFLGLSSLKTLDLSRNQLTELSESVLMPLLILQSLNLSMNNLKVLNEASFSSLLYLQQLDVSWNMLGHVTPGSLQLPNLTRLLLAGNPNLGGSHKPPLFIGTNRRLQTVDASHTGLKQVPKALTHSIRSLTLAKNVISSINCGDLDSYPLLQLLDLTSNHLSNIEEDALGRLDSLIILYLTNNKLHSIPHSLPDKLRVLHLEYNEIQSIQASDLDGLKQLEVLLIPHNKIKTVKEAAFNELTSLLSLDLSFNPIISLPTGSLTGPLQLHVLKMAGLNVISPLKEVEFPLPTPEYLITLDLSNSPGLAHQILADTAALAGAKELQELNLAMTNLNYIRSDLLHFLPQLRIMHLYNNPLNCSNLQWLAEWMRKQNEAEYRTVICASPPNLQNTLLVDLQSIQSGMKNNAYLHTTKNMEMGNKNAKFVIANKTVTKYIVGYQENEHAKAKNISERKSSLKKVTKNFNWMHSTSDSNTFMKKPIQKLEKEQKHKNHNLLESNIDKISVNALLQRSSTDLRIWEQENVTAEMLIYREESQNKFPQPGMVILVAGFFASATICVICIVRNTCRNRRIEQDVEVNRLPIFTELW